MRKMPTYRVRREADDLTIEDEQHGGREVMDDLLREVYPTPASVAGKVVGTKGAGNRSQQSVEFFEAISGAPKNSKTYENTRRNFQRYVSGRSDSKTRTSKPKLATVEGYQARYQAATGKRSPILDQLIEAAGGKVPTDTAITSTLPRGTLEIKVKARIKVITGAKKHGQRPQDDTVRAVPVTINADQRALQKQAIADPLSVWDQLFREYVSFEASDIDWMEVTFTPKAG